jgi:hypothetical protein
LAYSGTRDGAGNPSAFRRGSALNLQITQPARMLRDQTH